MTRKVLTSYTITTGLTPFARNNKRIGLLIQNQGVATVYFLNEKASTNTVRIEIDGQPYSDIVGADAPFILSASASCAIVIEEILKD